MTSLGGDQIAFEATPFESRLDTAAPLADALFRHLPSSGARILDLGCGTGAVAIAAALSKPNAELVGIDISEPNTRRAATLAEGAGVAGRVRFVCASLTEFDDPARFDAIVSDGVLHLIALPDRDVATKLALLLRPGGVLVATLPDLSRPNAIRLLLRRIWKHAPKSFDRVALALAHHLYPHVPVAILRDRVPYLRYIPPRLHGPDFAGALTDAGLERVDETGWPSDSIAKLRHRLIVWRRL